jgi:hypothetical protein
MGAYLKAHSIGCVVSAFGQHPSGNVVLFPRRGPFRSIHVRAPVKWHVGFRGFPEG